MADAETDHVLTGFVAAVRPVVPVVAARATVIRREIENILASAGSAGPGA